MHDLVIVGVPLLAILAGAFFNNQGLARLETRIDRLQADLTAMRSEFHREFEQFYRTLGQHDARIDTLEKQN
jgi:hypothetical protein